MEKLRAFPSAAIADEFGGMTLRDWFAGQALPSVVAATSAGQHMLSGTGTVHDMIAQDAYRLADAMLAERAKPCKP